MILGKPERLVLGVVPARAQVEHEAAAADGVGGHRHLREQPGVAIGGARDELTDLDTARCGGERRRDRPRLVHSFERCVRELPKKWSLTQTESSPSSSARVANSRISGQDGVPVRPSDSASGTITPIARGQFFNSM